MINISILYLSDQRNLKVKLNGGNWLPALLWSLIDGAVPEAIIVFSLVEKSPSLSNFTFSHTDNTKLD